MIPHGVSEQDFAVLETLVISPLKKSGASVWLFGSRATRNQFKFSDVDLLIEPNNSQLRQILSKVKEDIEESSFPYKVDLVIIDDLADSYREQVLKDRVKL